TASARTTIALAARTAVTGRPRSSLALCSRTTVTLTVVGACTARAALASLTERRPGPQLLAVDDPVLILVQFLKRRDRLRDFLGGESAVPVGVQRSHPQRRAARAEPAASRLAGIWTLAVPVTSLPLLLPLAFGAIPLG